MLGCASAAPPFFLKTFKTVENSLTIVIYCYRLIYMTRHTRAMRCRDACDRQGERRDSETALQTLPRPARTATNLQTPYQPNPLRRITFSYINYFSICTRLDRGNLSANFPEFLCFFFPKVKIFFAFLVFIFRLTFFK